MEDKINNIESLLLKQLKLDKIKWNNWHKNKCMQDNLIILTLMNVFVKKIDNIIFCDKFNNQMWKKYNF